MKFIGGLICAIYAVVGLVSSASATIQGISMHINGNGGNASTFVALFETTNGRDWQDPRTVSFDFLLPFDKSGEYKDMKCVVEFDKLRQYSRRFQVYSVPVTQYTPATASSVLATQVVGFKGVSSGLSSPGQFQLACSFIYTAALQAAPAAVFASSGEEEGSVQTQAVFKAYNGFAADYSIYLAHGSDDVVSSTFAIRQPHRRPIIQAREIIISNPSSDAATSGSTMTFKSVSSSIITPCTAYWNGVLQPNSVHSHVLPGDNNLSMKLVFSSFITSANEIVVLCPHIFGVKTSPYLPSIVVTDMPASHYGQNHFTLVATRETL